MLPVNSRSLRFLLSGGTATAIHFAAMGGLIVLGVDAASATAVGALLGAAVNYGLQYRWTFGSARAHRETIPTFLGASLTYWLLNLVLFSSLTRLALLPALPAQTLTTFVLILLNYGLYRKVVFT